MTHHRTAIATGVTLVVCATACNDAPTSYILPDSVEVRLANPVAWPGTDLVLVSTALASQQALPVVLLDTLHLPVARRDDSTMTARLPETSGVFALHVQLQGGDRYGTVRIVGFTGRSDAPPLTGWPVPLSPGSPVVIAAAETSLVELDLRTGATRDLGIRHNGSCAIAPGPSFRDQTIVAQADTSIGGGPCAPAVAWALDSPPSPLDSVPFGQNGSVGVWAELALGKWLMATHHFIYVYESGPAMLTEQMESGERVRFSPDRSLAIVLAQSAINDVPVLESATGTIKFRMPLVTSEAAVFSPDGDTIFISGKRDFGAAEPERMLAVSPSGQVAVDTALAMPRLWDLVLDPEAPWIYGVSTEHLGPRRPVIHVLDRRTLGYVARIEPPAAIICRAIPFCGQVGLAISASDRKLYLLEVAGWGNNPVTTPSAIFAIDLVPTTQGGQVLSP